MNLAASMNKQKTKMADDGKPIVINLAANTTIKKKHQHEIQIFKSLIGGDEKGKIQTVAKPKEVNERHVLKYYTDTPEFHIPEEDVDEMMNKLKEERAK